MKSEKKAPLEQAFFEGFISQQPKQSKQPIEESTPDSPTPKTVNKPIEASAENPLANIVEKVCTHYSIPRNTIIQVGFYPYTGLKSTIKIRRDKTIIKFSDVLKDAPIEILEALLHILICRAKRIQPPAKFSQLYSDYISLPHIEEKHAATRVSRSRKVLVGTKGKYYDLDKIYNQINTEYFGGSLNKPTLSWSPKRSRRLLGYHDPHLNLVVISRWLDRKVVPPYVVDYIMFHELLHTVVPIPVVNGRRQVHSKEFKQLEKQFRYFDQANHWLSHAGLSKWE